MAIRPDTEHSSLPSSGLPHDSAPTYDQALRPRPFSPTVFTPGPPPATEVFASPIALTEPAPGIGLKALEVPVVPEGSVSGANIFKAAAGSDGPTDDGKAGLIPASEDGKNDALPAPPIARIPGSAFGGSPRPPDRDLPARTDGDDGDETPEQAFQRFRTRVASLQDAVGNPTAHEDFLGYDGDPEAPEGLLFQIGDPTDPTGAKDCLVTIAMTPEGLGSEQRRYEALKRAGEIANPRIQAHLEKVVAAEPTAGLIIRRKEEGKPLDDLSPGDKRGVTPGDLVDSVEVIEAMVAHNIVPNPHHARKTLAKPGTGLIFTDFITVEQSTINADPDRPVRTVATILDGLTAELKLYPPGDARMEAASKPFNEMGQRALRNYYLYEGSIALATERLTEDEIRTIYALTRPTESGIAQDLHDASELHDLALSEEMPIDRRRELLKEAQRAYTSVVNPPRSDKEDDHVSPATTTDRRDHSLLTTNDQFLQARLALAFWPVSTARVEGERLILKERLAINHNLATILDEMISSGDDITSHPYIGHLTEVMSMLLLAPSALPTSEVRRLYGGPDAGVLFRNETDSACELDVDCKIQRSGSANRPGEVYVGNILTRVLSVIENPPRNSDGTPFDVYEAVSYTAGLLRDEGLRRRTLTADEITYLKEIQKAISRRIFNTAEQSFGVIHLQNRARFQPTGSYAL